MFHWGGLKGLEIIFGLSPEMSLQWCPPPLEALFSNYCKHDGVLNNLN
jgi:hypothetical protein